MKINYSNHEDTAIVNYEDKVKSTVPNGHKEERSGLIKPGQLRWAQYTSD